MIVVADLHQSRRYASAVANGFISFGDTLSVLLAFVLPSARLVNRVKKRELRDCKTHSFSYKSFVLKIVFVHDREPGILVTITRRVTGVGIEQYGNVSGRPDVLETGKLEINRKTRTDKVEWLSRVIGLCRRRRSSNFSNMDVIHNRRPRS